MNQSIRVIAAALGVSDVIASIEYGYNDEQDGRKPDDT